MSYVEITGIDSHPALKGLQLDDEITITATLKILEFGYHQHGGMHVEYKLGGLLMDSQITKELA